MSLDEISVEEITSGHKCLWTKFPWTKFLWTKLPLDENVPGRSFTSMRKPQRENWPGVPTIIETTRGLHPRDSPHNLSTFDTPNDDILTSARRAAGIPSTAPEEIFKNENLKVIKITYQHRSHAKAAKKRGVPILFFLSEHQIAFGEIISVKQCMRCYTFEYHTTQECKATTMVCYECASEGHTHRHCPNPRPLHCINCRREGRDSNYQTLANFCPAKKEIIRRKRNEIGLHQENKRREHLPVVAAVEQAITNMMAPMSADPVSYWPAFPGKKPPLSSTPLPATPKPANNKNFNQSSTISQQIKLIAILPLIMNTTRHFPAPSIKPSTGSSATTTSRKWMWGMTGQVPPSLRQCRPKTPPS